MQAELTKNHKRIIGFIPFLAILMDQGVKFFISKLGWSALWTAGILGGTLHYRGGFMAYLVPVIFLGVVFCYFLLALKYLSNFKLLSSMALFLGALASNTIDRVLFNGLVMDYLPVTRSLTTNLAGILEALSILGIIFYIYQDHYLFKELDQRKKLFIDWELQKKVFRDHLIIGFILCLIVGGIMIMDTSDYKAVWTLLFTMLCVVPLFSFFGVLLSNSRYGPLKGLERFIVELKETGGTSFQAREGDNLKEIEKLIELIKNLK